MNTVSIIFIKIIGNESVWISRFESQINLMQNLLRSFWSIHLTNEFRFVENNYCVLKIFFLIVPEKKKKKFIIECTDLFRWKVVVQITKHFAFCVDRWSRFTLFLSSLFLWRDFQSYIVRYIEVMGSSYLINSFFNRYHDQSQKDTWFSKVYSSSVYLLSFMKYSCPQKL